MTVSISLALPLAAAVVAAAASAELVTVKGETRCPAPTDVAARIARLLPAPLSPRDSDVAELQDAGAELRISLHRRDGTPMGQRALAPKTAFSCADLAAAAAVIIATWESDVHPEFKLDPGEEQPRRPPLSLQPPSLISRPRSLPPQTPQTQQATRASRLVIPPPSSPSPPAALARTASTPAVVVAGPRSLDLGVAAFGALAPGGDTVDSGAAAGGLVSVVWAPLRGGWGAHFGLQGTTERAIPLPSGTVRWRRFSLAMGPRRRWTMGAGRWALELHGDAVAALLTIRGTDFASNGGDRSFDAGAGAGARLASLPGSSERGLRRVQPWLDLVVTVWPMTQLVYERPAGNSATLPRFEGIVALGVSYWTGL